MPTTSEEDEYVLVPPKPAVEVPSPSTSLSASSSWSDIPDSSSDAGDVEELSATAPAAPFLPALDASTEIRMHDGYDEAIAEAQSVLDSRLLAYSRYLATTHPEDHLLIPTRTYRPRPGAAATPSKPVAGDRPVTVCMGWQRVSNIDSTSRDLLRVLEEDGVSYEPHDLAYSVKYLAPVAPFGDCMFLSIEQLLLHTDECPPLPTAKIRRLAATFFAAHYRDCREDERARIDVAIRNLYFPSLQGGWGVSPIQTRRYVARRSDKDWLFAKCLELQERGYSRLQAAELVYAQYAQPVVNAEVYGEYMSVGFGAANTHFIIALSYSRAGLVAVDADADDRRVAWGDDLALEALATAYQRDIFVVLVGCGKMFFLPHRPRRLPTLAAPAAGLARSKGHAPWFLLMRLTGSDRGGDHYEPMLCERLRGDGADEFGTIGD